MKEILVLIFYIACLVISCKLWDMTDLRDWYFRKRNATKQWIEDQKSQRRLDYKLWDREGYQDIPEVLDPGQDADQVGIRVEPRIPFLGKKPEVEVEEVLEYIPVISHNHKRRGEQRGQMDQNHNRKEG